MELIRNYMVTGSWIDKVTKTPKTGLVEIKVGKNQETGNPYQMTDANSRLIIDGTHDIGGIIPFKMIMITSENTSKPSQNQNLKINSQQ